MGTRFGTNYPATISRVNERERLWFFAAAGLFFSLLILVLFVLNFKRSASAVSDQTPEAISQVPVAMGTIKLLTPDNVISAGKKLSEVTFKEVYWPRNQVPEGAVMDLAELRGMYSKAELHPGVPIKRADLSTQPQYPSLPVTPGMRAVSLSIDAVAGVEGHARPGSRVDVVLTFMDDGELTSKVIVENARVLSTGGDPNRGTTARTVRRPSKTITLEVSPANALKIHTSRELGRINLIMRAAGDELPVENSEIGRYDIQGPKDVVKRPIETCTKGRMRIGDSEYMLDCNGGLHQLDSFEP